MTAPLRIFISATSKDLGPACETAASILRAACRLEAEIHLMADMGFYDGTIPAKLKSEIKSADVVIHIVGKRYGRAPLAPFHSPAGYPCSYTQLEYWLAKKYRKFVPVILCAETFPYSPATTAERDSETRCQNDHRRYIENADFEKIAVEDLNQFKLAIHMIGHTLLHRIAERLRQRSQNFHRIILLCTTGLALMITYSRLIPKPPEKINNANIPIAPIPQLGISEEEEAGLIGIISKHQDKASETN